MLRYGTTETKDIYAGNELVATVTDNGSTVTPYYVHTDAIEGSNVITDATGTQAQLLDYYPYGQVRLNEQAGSFNEQKQYGGHYFDSDTALNYFGARYYNSSSGQFISEDPAFLAIGDEKQVQSDANSQLTDILKDPQLLNSYSYARENPIVNIDSNGKWSEQQIEGAQYLYDNSSAWKFAIDHPVVTGAITALMSVPALGSGSLAASAFQMATYPGVGATFAAQQTIAGLVYSGLTVSSTLSVPEIISNVSKGNSDNPSSFYPAALSVTKELGPSLIGGHIGAVTDAVQVGNVIGKAITDLFSFLNSGEKSQNNKNTE